MDVTGEKTDSLQRFWWAAHALLGWLFGEVGALGNHSGSLSLKGDTVEQVNRSWLLGLFVLSVFGCATTRYEEYGATDAECQTLPVTLDALIPLQDAVGRLEAQMDTLEAQVAACVDSLAVRGAEKGMRDGQEGVAVQLRDLAEQVDELRKQLLPQDAPPAEDERAAGVYPQVWDVTRLYEQGLMDYNARRYDQAAEVFRQVMARDSQGDLADNARYWLGECQFAQGDHRAALESFRMIFGYAKTEKYDDAQLKIGLCYLRLGDDESAALEFERMIAAYPESEYLGRAEYYLQTIRDRQGEAP